MAAWRPCSATVNRMSDEPNSGELSKAYDPSEIEEKWARYWAEERLFDVPSGEDDRKPFTMLLPPPNVTGFLHMGHMFEHAESDILVRWHRMKGERALWVPGTDHAGIATQMLVERQLAKEGNKPGRDGSRGFSPRGSGRGSNSTAARLRRRCAGWVRAWTGRANISRWTNVFRQR